MLLVSANLYLTIFKRYLEEDHEASTTSLCTVRDGDDFDPHINDQLRWRLGFPLNTFTVKQFRGGLGGMLSPPSQIAGVPIKGNFPFYHLHPPPKKKKHLD